MNKKLCEACKLIEEINQGHRIGSRLTVKPGPIDRGIAFLLKDKCTCDKPIELDYIKDWGSYIKFDIIKGALELNFVALYDNNKNYFVVEYYNEKGHLVEQSYVGCLI